MYTIGIDFGTESGRAVLVDTSNGDEIATAVHSYSNGVIDEALPGSDKPLPPDWALQDPRDYIDVIKTTVPQVLRESGVDPAEVVGIGIDFTACTMMPTKRDGTPLMMFDEWRDNPHAWVKLWKHHASQPQADQINEVARQMGEDWLQRYGGKISSEWFFSKALQILQEAPDVYNASERLIEAADWVIWQLTGVETRNACTAGYKAIVQDGDFPSEAYFGALDPRFADVVETRMSREFAPLGSKAGGLTEEAAEWTGLPVGTAVAVANVDAHVTVPAVTVTQPGQMVIIMGTSNCHMLIGEELQTVEGMCGVVRDGIIPGYYGYEAGQSGVGDIFAWFVNHAVPPEYHEAARAAGKDIHEYLEHEAAKQKPGEHGLVALDWWNGNRSPLVDADLTGLLLGATLATRAPDIYRALIEATAYGTRIIIEAFEEQGIPVNELVVAGGLPEKNKLLVQIYVDVTGKPMKFAASSQAPAVGAAMHAAVAASVYPNIQAAAQKMGRIKDEVVHPIPENQAIYEQLYAEYKLLYEYFGKGANDVMKRLKNLKMQVRGETH
ncbi:MAG: ribulokinase [Chloroflexi bacterium]|nr:MAG: ribulokinase [Chloroflexota bacterium]